MGKMENRVLRASLMDWPSHNHLAPPGLEGVISLFTWIGALDRARQIEGMTSAEQPHARRGLAQWLWLNGVRGEACWAWGQG
jgi:hypothetical protein